MFLQKCQNFQKLCCPILATWLRVNPVACPQLQAYSVGLHNSLACQSPSREILGFRFLATLFGDLFTSGSFSHELTQKFSRLPSRLPRGWNFQSQKTLRQNFFCHKLFGDLSATWFSRENRVCCTITVFIKIGFKKISFFPHMS